MNTETMTVHRALADLKTLDSRITSKISSACFVRANKHSNKKINGAPISDFESSAKDDYKSIVTMINRRNAMKRAVVLSNAQTKVEIDGITYTVAEAIEMKNHGISNEQALMRALSTQYSGAVLECERRNGDELERNATNYVTGMYGSKDAKDLGDMVEEAKKLYIENNTYDLIDPLCAKSKFEKLEADVSTFMADVDAALSVSNAITEITFSYEVM